MSVTILVFILAYQLPVTILVFILAYQLLAYFYEVVVENTMVNFYDYFSIHFSLSTIGLLL